MRSSSLVAPILTALLLLSTSARGAAPDEARAKSSAPVAEPNAELAFMVGAGAAMIPIIFGAALASSGPLDVDRNRGLGVAGAGFVLAPLVSHAVLGEFRRAAFYSALPAASVVGMVALMQSQENAVFRGTAASRTVFGALLCLDMASSVIGLIDAAMAADRARGKSFILAPSVAHDRIGIIAIGAL